MLSPACSQGYASPHSARTAASSSRSARTLYRQRRPANVSAVVWEDLYDAIVASIAIRLIEEFVQAHARGAA